MTEKITVTPPTTAQMSKNIATKLDEKDGKKDGKISASVWNEFVKDKGGKTIKYSITLENAEKSISTYLAKNSKSTGKNKTELSFEWLMKEITAPSKGKKTTDIKGPADLKNLSFGKSQTPKELADEAAKFITGKSERYSTPSKKNAAEVFHELSKHFKGKIPLTLGTHLYLLSMYPALLKQADELGIKTNYKEDTHFGNGNYEIAKNRLKACIDLKNKILNAKKSQKA